MINRLATLTNGIVISLPPEILFKLLQLIPNNPNYDSVKDNVLPLLTKASVSPDFKLSIYQDVEDSPTKFIETYKIDLSNLTIPSAEMIKDVGYFATSTVDYFRSVLNRLNIKLDEKIVGDMLLMMIQTLDDLDKDKDSTNLAIGSLNDSFYPNNSLPNLPSTKTLETMPHVSTWNYQTVATLLTQDYPKLDWCEVIRNLDQPSENITLPGVQFLVNIVVQATQNQFPGHILCGRWKNQHTQFKLLNDIVKAPPNMVSFTNTQNQLRKNYGAWSSIDLMNTFLHFCETKYYPQVLQTLLIPLTTCPTALFLLVLLSNEGNSECQRHLIFQALSSYFKNSPTVQEGHEPLNINEIISYVNDLKDSKISIKLAQSFSLYLSTQIDYQTTSKIEAAELMISYINQYKSSLSSQYNNIFESSKCIPDNVNAIFQSIYNKEKSTDEVIAMLKVYQKSPYPIQKQTIDYMVNNLISEFAFFKNYPDKELHITAGFLGQLIENDLVNDAGLEEIFRNIQSWLLQGVDKMTKFAIRVIEQAKRRLSKNPVYLNILLNNRTLRTYAPQLCNELESCVSKDPQESPFKKCFRYVPPTPIISPPSNIKETISFKINNLADSNIKDTVNTVKTCITDEYIPWFTDYLVLKRIATSDVMFLKLYLSMLEEINIPRLTELVHTKSLQVLCDLFTSTSIQESNERTMIKNLAEWINLNTIQRNKPVLYRDINVKELLLVGYENGKLYAVLAFVCTLLSGCFDSKVFNVSNYWIKSLLSLLLEIKNQPGLKSGLQYQIELLLNYKLKCTNRIRPSDLLKLRLRTSAHNEDFTDDIAPQSAIPIQSVPVIERTPSLVQYPPPSPPISRIQPTSRISESMTQIPHLDKYIKINKSLTLFNEQPSLLQYVYSAIDAAFREVASPVVTRTVNIAIKTAQQLVVKDFNGEKNVQKLVYPARTLVSSLASNLSLISSREVLKTKLMERLTNQLSPVSGLNKDQLNSLCETLTEDNIDLGCQYIERTASLKATARIENTLTKYFADNIYNKPPTKIPINIPSSLSFGETENNEHIYDFFKQKVDFRKKEKKFIEGTFEEEIYVSKLLNLWIKSIKELYEPKLEDIKQEIDNKNENELEELFCLLMDEAFGLYKLEKYQVRIRGVEDYTSFDALGRFISKYYLFDPNNKIFLKSALRGITNHLLFNHDECMESEQIFYQNVYFRIFINLLNELMSFNEIPIQQTYEFLSVLSNAFITLQPKRVPMFAFSWIQLISHRFFLPRLLSYQNGQLWPYMEQILLSLLSFFYPFFITTLNDSLKILYKATLRVLLVLLHDYPEFLGSYYFSLCDNIPLKCVQLRNIILSAFPKSMQLPDPFTPNLKIEALPGINQPPIIKSDVSNSLVKFNIKTDIDTYLSTNSTNTDFLASLIKKLKLPPATEGEIRESSYNIPLVNSLTLYLGIQGINLTSNRSMDKDKNNIVMNVFLYFAKELDAEGRFVFFNALANQLRYPNSYTHYFSCVILYLFAENSKPEYIREQITRVLIERLIVHRPHPWGLLITFYELLQNSKYEFWSHEFTKRTPDIQKLFDSVARSCQNTRNISRNP